MRSIVSFILLAACGSTDPRGFAEPNASTSGGVSSGSVLGASGGSGGTMMDAGEPGLCPNVDILFVIDNSGSMADKQERLARSFPGFSAAIRERLKGAKTANIGVVATSRYYGTDPQECLIKKTSGPGSSNMDCLKGASYIAHGDGQLDSKFACVAKVGAGGDSDETPVRSMLGALDPANACNQGFARKDALLILVVITDEDDAKEGDCDPVTGTGTCGSGGTPAEWAQKVVALRGGVKGNVMVLSLLARSPNTCANGPTVNLLRFTHEFGANGLVGNVCDNAYDTFFRDALPVFDKACATYTPPR
jgi:hypothetical protein